MAITADTLVAVAVFKDELEVKDQKIRYDDTVIMAMLLVAQGLMDF